MQLFCQSAPALRSFLRQLGFAILLSTFVLIIMPKVTGVHAQTTFDAFNNAYGTANFPCSIKGKKLEDTAKDFYDQVKNTVCLPKPPSDNFVRLEDSRNDFVEETQIGTTEQLQLASVYSQLRSTPQPLQVGTLLSKEVYRPGELECSPLVATAATLYCYELVSENGLSKYMNELETDKSGAGKLNQPCFNTSGSNSKCCSSGDDKCSGTTSTDVVPGGVCTEINTVCRFTAIPPQAGTPTATPVQQAVTSRCNQSATSGEWSIYNKCISTTVANGSSNSPYTCGPTYGSCAPNYSCCYFPAPPTPTPIPPQSDLAGEIGYECKKLYPGSDALDIWGGEASAIRKGPLIGGFLSDYLLDSPKMILDRFMENDNEMPLDIAAHAPDNAREALFEYTGSCGDSGICARTRNIGYYIDPNNPPNIVGDDICVRKTDIDWGSYVVQKKAEFDGKTTPTPAMSSDSKTGRTNVAASGLGADDDLEDMDIKSQLGDMCFRQIKYSSAIVDAFVYAPFSDDYVNGFNNEYTDTATDTEWYKIVAGKLGNLWTGTTADVVRSMSESIGGGLLKWADLRSFFGGRAYIYALLSRGNDYGQLRNYCRVGRDLNVYDDTFLIPAFCQDAPPTGKIGKDLIMNMDDKILAGHLIPKTKIQGAKSALAQCLDCAHEGKISTALGCIPVTNVQKFITETIFGIGLGIAGSFCVLCLVFGAIMFQTSQGNSTQIQKARKLIQNCILGLLVIIFALFILKFIGVDILRIPGFGS